MNFPAPTIALVLGLAIPIVHRVITKVTLPAWAASVVAAVLAGGAAVLANVTGVTGSLSLNSLVETFLLAAVSAGGTTVSLTGGPVLDTVSSLTSKVGLPITLPSVTLPFTGPSKKELAAQLAVLQGTVGHAGAADPAPAPVAPPPPA